jgi:hypothetical protein
MQADEYICALTSGKKKGGKEEKTGELYYSKQSIYNAKRQNDGTVTLHRFSWSRKQNETAPEIVFNYNWVNNHYLPKWASNEIDMDLPGSAFVSLSSNKNMTNIPKDKATGVLDFKSFRDIIPNDFQKLLSLGLYAVVPNLLNEVAEYLECSLQDVTKAINIRRAAHNRNYTSDVNINRLCKSLSKTKHISGHSFKTSIQSKILVLIKILITVEVDGKARWTDKYFRGNLNGFLLLLPRSKCGTFCVVVAFIYIDHNGSVQCCTLDEKGNAATTTSN